MKLGIFINQPLFFDGNQYTCDYHTLLPFTFSLLEYLDRIDILAPVQFTLSRKARNIIDIPEGIKIIALPYYGPLGVIPALHKLVPATVIKTLQLKKQWDITGCIMPSAAGLAFDIASIGKKKFYLIRGNKAKTLKVLHSANRTNHVVLLAGRLVDKFMQCRINQGVHAFVLGQELFDIFKNDHNSVHIWKGLLPDNLINEYPGLKPGQPKKTFNILFVGRLTPEKGVYDLLAIIKSAYETEKQIVVHIVGEGPLRNDLENKVHMLNLEHTVKFLGALAHPDPLFKEYDWADVFLLPSYTEGIPRAIAEAMSRGVPVVASAVGGIPYIIKDQIDGILVAAGDIERFVEGLLTLINDNGIRNNISKNGYYKAVQLFSDHAQREEMAQILGL
jgi:glycosyltransferase involved in cell wall biosynthesis